MMFDFHNLHHVHAHLLYTGDDLSHFYFSFSYMQSIPPEIWLHYSLCGM